jgi:predicted ester cyclase
MRYSRTFCLVAIVCGGLTLTSWAQTKPGAVAIQPAGPQVRQQPQMAMERNKVPVRQLYEEIFSQGRYELLNQAFAPNAKVHFGGRNISLQESVSEGKGWRSAAPDLRMVINNITANGDMVTVNWTAIGTHTGQGHGLKPSGKRVNMQGTSRFRVVNGKIVEAWNEEYRPELFRQLGVSKTQAFMFFTTEKVLAALDPIIPNRVYALVFE